MATQLRLKSGGISLPKPGKYRGEDAFFARGNAVGVADGVGAWAARGIDSGKFSRAMMAHAAQYSASMQDPTQLMARAYRDSQHHEGSATVCLLTLDGAQRTLRSSVLGDCGFMVLRDHRPVHASTAQTHSFNLPFQLGTGGDPPHRAQNHALSVRRGDRIITGSDGLFDNLHAHEIQRVARQHVARSPQDLARALANAAYFHSVDPTHASPFAEEARKQGVPHIGGKPDDITVVVSDVA